MLTWRAPTVMRRARPKPRTEMAGTAQLYTTEILALAVELADYPLTGEWQRRAAARAQVCGSAIKLGLDCDTAGRFERVGVQAQACAIGQAAAAIFARHAKGRTFAEIGTSRDAIAGWLAEGGSVPDWPDLDRLEAARAYPARHGAIMLPWKAAATALSPAGEAG